MPQIFLSENRNSSTTLEDLSERWRTILAQAALNLKATTQKVTRSAIMPLARRYRSDQMFEVKSIQGIMSTNTMDTRCKSINGHEYSQVFGNKQLFFEA